MDNDDWGFYTAICEYYATGEGFTRILKISYGRNEEQITREFVKEFGVFLAAGVVVKKGIDIPEDYVHLLTDYAKKVILKIKSKSEDAPNGFAYSNYIYQNYS